MLFSTALAIGSLLIKAGGAISDKMADDKAARRNRRSAKLAGAVERRDLSIRQIEETTGIQRQIEGIRLRADTAEGAVQASAAGAGVKGSSIQAILGDLRAREGEAVMGLKEQNLVTISQLQRQKAGATAKERSRIASVPKGSWGLAGLQIAGAAIGTAATIKGRT